MRTSFKSRLLCSGIALGMAVAVGATANAQVGTDEDEIIVTGSRS